ncbi:hypothetical protein PHMEG_0009074 [Phytophthora megakarya]|uniref:Uncharacterized protein n=1 Tax=Phytophthora megakarya TaxID=4795 RepID=A0A225WJL2_9STRA|nr:hypothetical protein PHMEG_0009074 [Phytophthora megakarya]
MLTSLIKDKVLESFSRTGHEVAGEPWSWRGLLQQLLSILDNGVERDSGSKAAWREGKLAQRLGLRVCSLHQVLEALAFEYMEEKQWGYTIYHHHSFVLGHPDRVDEILALSPSPSTERDFMMPSIAYSSELNPLEVRLSLPDPLSKTWEVTIAPSILPLAILDASEDFNILQTADFGPAEGELLDNLDGGSDHDVNSPLWWSQHTDFSSICTDDLSDLDSLSQTSAVDRAILEMTKLNNE